MSRSLASVLIAGLIICSGSALAASSYEGVAVSLGVGTEGPGIQASMPLVSRTLDLNIGFSRFDYTHAFTASGTRFSGKATLGGEPITLSWYPFHGNFSLDAGMFVNQNQISVSGQPMGSGYYTINGHTYSASTVGSFSGRTHFNTVAPYVGIGWGNPFLGGDWTFEAQAGVVYNGQPAVRLFATGAAADPALASDVLAAQAAANSRLDFLGWWPVVGASIGYRF